MRLLHCNKCGKMIQNENKCRIKVEARIFDKNGRYIPGRGGKADLCEKCYKEIAGQIPGLLKEEQE